MCALYKVLKDKAVPIIYTNETLSKNCKISLRNVERRIPELIKMGFIDCKGRGYSRRISLGILFINSANMAVDDDTKLCNSAKYDSPTAKSDVSNRQYGGDSNPYTNPSSKGNILFSKGITQEQKQEIDFYLKNNQYKMPAPLSKLYCLIEEPLNSIQLGVE
jgi:hypothetical protein